MSRETNRCKECINWLGTTCKRGISGQFPCQLWGYNYAKLSPAMVGTPTVDPLHGEDITTHHAKLYGGN